jgi:hypothetical protein
MPDVFLLRHTNRPFHLYMFDSICVGDIDGERISRRVWWRAFVIYDCSRAIDIHVSQANGQTPRSLMTRSDDGYVKLLRY